MKNKFLTVAVMMSVLSLSTVAKADLDIGGRSTNITNNTTNNNPSSRSDADANSASMSNANSSSKSQAESRSSSLSGSSSASYSASGDSYAATKSNANGTVSNSVVSKVRPPAMAPSVATGNTTTISCRTGVGGSVGAMGLVSLGASGTTEDEDCTLRENIKIVSTIDPGLAHEMMKDLKGVKDALERINPTVKEEPIIIE